jgi:hypothetical protein
VKILAPQPKTNLGAPSRGCDVQNRYALIVKRMQRQSKECIKQLLQLGFRHPSVVS